MKFDQELCLNLLYDFKKSLWQDELNPRVRCAFGNVSLRRLLNRPTLSFVFVAWACLSVLNSECNTLHDMAV
jgi:hypothetical protein